MEMTRRYVHPDPSDTIEVIAQRVPDLAGRDDAAEQLLSWNLHLSNRLLGQTAGLLGSDIVYVEPPRRG
jgi:hypothetical protein